MIPEKTKYNTVHQRLRRIRGPASKHECVDCTRGLLLNKQWSYNGDDPHELEEKGIWYSINLEYYSVRCLLHHGKLDRKLRNDRSREAKEKDQPLGGRNLPQVS